MLTKYKFPIEISLHESSGNSRVALILGCFVWVTFWIRLSTAPGHSKQSVTMDHSEETRFKPCVPVAPTFSKDDIVETTSIQCALCVSRHASTAAISGVYLILVRRKVAQQTRTKVLKISTLSE